jgi:hypothetical protein
MLIFIRAITALLTISILSFGSAHAASISIYGDAIGDGDYSDSRTTGGGLTGIGEWSTDFDVSWLITNIGNGMFDYEYTFSGFGDPDKDISHVVIDLTDDCGSDPLCVTGATMDGDTIDSGSINIGDFDGITGAVKFDAGAGSIYSFTSNRAPVWGHLAVKSGGGSNRCGDYSAIGVYVCSNQLLDGVEGLSFDDADEINYIARPNGGIATDPDTVPVPAAVWLFGSALGLLGWIRRRSL